MNYLKLLAAGFLTALSFHSSAQSYEQLENNAAISKLDVNGDPITNIMDHNGARQGTWTYQDAFGNDFLSIEFKDNVELSRAYIGFDNCQELEHPQELEPYLDVNQSLKEIGIEIKSGQNYVIILDAKGKFAAFNPLGEWDLAEARKANDHFVAKGIPLRKYYGVHVYSNNLIISNN